MIKIGTSASLSQAPFSPLAPIPGVTAARQRVLLSPDALGIVHNLPAAAAAAALDPVVVLLVGDLQQDLDHGGIRLGDVLALPEMTQ